MLSILTIIPARGGSKGVPFKNKRIINGIPLIQYTTNIALQCEFLDDIYVSSDDDEILNIAKRGRIICMKRPTELSHDLSHISDTIEYVLHKVEEERQKTYDAILLLQPTAPLRERKHIVEIIQLLENSPEIKSIISLCEMRDMHPARMYNIENGILQSLLPENENTRRQELKPVYYRNGALYLVRRDAFLKQRTVMAVPSKGYVMEDKYLLNIDEPRDMKIAEVLLKEYLANESVIH